MAEARCACGSITFKATYQAWVTGTVTFDPAADAPHSVGQVEVNGQEMHSDWLTFLSCSDCGLTYRPQDGTFNDNDANDTEEQPGLVAAADALSNFTWSGKDLAWEEA